MTLKLLKLNANDATSNGASGIMSNGKVIFRNAYHFEAPSIDAASYNSFGMDWRAPKDMTII